MSACEPWIFACATETALTSAAILRRSSFNLAFEGSLLGYGPFECVPIRPVIDLKQQFALLHELVVTHVQPDDWSVHLRRDPDEIRKYFGIVGSWIVVGGVECRQTQSHGGGHDANTDHAAQDLAKFRTRINIHGSSLTKEAH